MSGQPGRPPNRLVSAWESLSPRTQALVAIPSLAVLLFLVNLGPFNQPLWRSIVYGIFEGGVLGGLLLVVTAQEKAKRVSGGGAGPAQEDEEGSPRHQGERGHDAEDLDGQA